MSKTVEIDGKQIIELQNEADGQTYIRVRVPTEQYAAVLDAMRPDPECEGLIHNAGMCQTCGMYYD
jgi:hypothetical protein